MKERKNKRIREKEKRERETERERQRKEANGGEKKNDKCKNASWVSMHIAHKQIESPVAQDSKIFQFPS